MWRCGWVSIQSHSVSVLWKLSITQIIVAHRPAAIATCNRVFHVENGQVIEVEKPANLTVPSQEPTVPIEATWTRGRFAVS